MFRKLVAQQNVQALEVESDANQGPFTCGRPDATQRELSEAKHFLDDPNDRLDRGFAQAIDCAADVSPKFVGHFHSERGIVGRRSRLLGEVLSPVVVMDFASSGNQ